MEINATFGHNAGDPLLKDIASRLTETLLLQPDPRVGSSPSRRTGKATTTLPGDYRHRDRLNTRRRRADALVSPRPWFRYVSPERFTPTIEQTGLACSFSQWLLASVPEQWTK